MFILDGNIRNKIGTSSSRLLRRIKNKFPGIIYGHHKPSLCIELNHNEVIHIEKNSDFYKKPLTINLNNKKYIVQVKCVQKHPYKLKILHIDFIYL